MTDWQPIETAPIKQDMLTVDCHYNVRVGEKYRDGTVVYGFMVGDESYTKAVRPSDEFYPVQWAEISEPPESDQ